MSSCGGYQHWLLTDELAEKLRTGLDEMRSQFMTHYVLEAASGQVQRVAMRFALVGQRGDGLPG